MNREAGRLGMNDTQFLEPGLVCRSRALFDGARLLCCRLRCCATSRSTPGSTREAHPWPHHTGKPQPVAASLDPTVDGLKTGQPTDAAGWRIIATVNRPPRKLADGVAGRA